MSSVDKLCLMTSQNDVPTEVLEVSRVSSTTRFVQVVSWMRHFYRDAQKADQRVVGELTAVE